jgi:branched-chain amino acid transport system permease protein
LAVCFGTWYVIERTKLGSYLRAGTENPALLQAFGINVPLMITLTYGYGVALAAFAGVLAAPIFNVNPVMGSNLIITVFAVVVVGGMGSIMGSIVTGIGLGLIEGIVKSGMIANLLSSTFDSVPVAGSIVYPIKLLFSPEASAVTIFVIMAIVLLVRPAGLFGRER